MTLVLSLNPYCNGNSNRISEDVIFNINSGGGVLILVVMADVIEFVINETNGYDVS